MQTATSMIFPAVAISTDTSGRRISGTLRLEAGGGYFEAENLRVFIPYSGLMIERGGANGRLYFLSHPSVGEYKFYSVDRKILRALGANADAGIRQQLQLIGEQTIAGRRAVGLGLLTAALFIIGVIFAKDPVVAFVARQIPLSWENKAGEVIFEAVKDSQGVITSETVTERFRTFVQPMTEALAESGITPKVYVVRSEELNAFALPGGYVIVNSGLILAAERAEEIMGVMAHEFAHVSERHVLRNLISALGIYALFDLLIGNVAGTIAVLTDLGPRLIQMGFSRDFERQADAVGFSYMLKANVDPQGMVDVFERFRKQSEILGLDKLEKHLSFLSTHPSNEERIAVLKENLAKLPPTEYRDFGSELSEVQDTLRRALGIEVKAIGSSSHASGRD